MVFALAMVLQKSNFISEQQVALIAFGVTFLVYILPGIFKGLYRQYYPTSLDYDPKDDFIVRQTNLINELILESSKSSVFKHLSNRTGRVGYKSSADYAVDRSLITIQGVRIKPEYKNINLYSFQSANGDCVIFLPDKMYFGQRNLLFWTSFQEIEINFEEVSFQESYSNMPNDAEKLDQTWEYVNADGSPDMRFSRNPESYRFVYNELTINVKDRFSYTIQISNKIIAEEVFTLLNNLKINATQKVQSLAHNAN